MKFLLFSLFLSLSILLTPSQAVASHSMGADLTYTCLGGNTYKLRLTFYRDCYGVAADINPFISISSASCGQSLSIYLDTIPGTGQEITPICPSATSTCNGGSYTGIQEWIYEGTITLPAQCPDWVFSYALCCRNAAITTVSGPSAEDIYIYSTLNNTISPCNNSPTFSNKPVPFVCVGQQFCFNHGASDADGDSLAYSLLTPLGNFGAPVTYLSPYSASQPFNSAPPMTFDPLTGDFCATPQSIEVTIMAVLVKEYRNGVLIGEVERDMQITVIPCANTLPSLTGIDGTNNFTATVCADEPYCFSIYSNDADAGQTVSMSWDSSITGATLTISGSPFPSGSFCWTPTQADVTGNGHCFTVKVSDDACPYYGTQVYSYCITVVNLTVDAGPDQSVACGNTTTITATPAGSSGNYTYLWSNGSTAASQTVGAGTYTVTVSNGLCTATDDVTINPLTGPAAAFTPAGGCSPTVSFTDQSVILNGTITAWDWDFGDGNTSAQQNTTHTYSLAGTYTACLIVSSSGGCTDTTCMDITITDPPVADFNTTNVCDGTAVTVNNTSSPSGAISTYAWDFGNSTVSGLQNPSVLYSTDGNYTITLVVTDTVGCSDTIQQPVSVYPMPVPSFTIGYTPCTSLDATFTDNSTGSISTWSWDFGDGQSSSLSNPQHSYSSGGPYSITLVVTSGDGCIDSVTQPLDIVPPVVPVPGPSQAVCAGQQAIISASGGSSYLWSDGQTGSPVTVSPATSTLYTVTVTDANGCSDTTSVLVTIFPLPQPVVSADTALCAGQSLTLYAGGGTGYAWSTGDVTDSVFITPATSTVYAVTVTDANGCSASDSVAVTVNVPPVVALANNAVCDGDTVWIDAGLAGMSYLWNSGQVTQVIEATVSGTYTVTVTDGNGCTGTAQSVVTIFPLPVLNVTPDQVICAGQTAVLTAGGADTYQWSTSATGASISVSPQSSTIYTVTGTDINGCEASAAITVSVNIPPVVSMSDTSVCPGSSVTLDAGISGLNYLWSTGESTQSVTVLLGGVYIVTVTDLNGCSDTAQATVTIFASPQVSAGTNSDICEGESIALTAFGALSYVWNTGDLTPAINVSPSSATLYAVTGTDGNGCTDTSEVLVNVHPLPVLSIPNALVCPGSSATLNAGQSGSSYLWSNGQTTQTVVVTLPGNYTVTVADAWGCSATQTVQVAPGGSISNNSNVVSFCSGGSAVLDAGNPGNTYLWSPGGQTTQTISVSGSGLYSVVVTNPNGCSGMVNTNVIVNPLPVAGFSATGGCAGQPVAFTDTSLVAAGSVSQWSWDFGDGSTSLQQNPVHAYSLGGNFVVTLTVVSDSGCTASAMQNINTASLPVANFTVASACEGMPVQFSDASAGTNLSAWGWNFGDGSTAATQNPVHNYALPGLYTVTLTVSTAAGCTGSKTNQVNVHSAPVAQFSASVVCQGFNTIFTDLSFDTSASVTSWEWNFGDQDSSLQHNPLHVYAASGSYPVQLVVTSSNGCVDTVILPVTVKPLPVANAGPNQGLCQGQPVTLYASGGTSYLWSNGQTSSSITVNPPATTSYVVTVTNGFGCTATDAVTVGVGTVPVVSLADVFICTGNSAALDAGNAGSTFLWSNGQTTQTIFVSTPGNYSVIVTNIANCSSTASAVVTVGGSGLSNNLNDTAVCPGQLVTFDAGNTGHSFLWTTGDTTQVITANTSGTYTVTVTDTGGCAASFSAVLTVSPSPSAVFSSANPCVLAPATFTDASLISNGTIASYTWNFGDGSFSQLPNPVHSYATAGVYVVTLSVVSDMGCADTATGMVQVHQSPSASFTAPATCVYNNISFTDNSSVLNDTLASWNWSFGDNTSAASQSSFHQYANAGTYAASLVVTTVNGCTDTTVQNVVVYPAPVASFIAPPVCENSPVAFTDSSSITTGAINSWSWSFGDGTTGTMQHPAHLYVSYGTYQTTLIVTSGYGCTDTSVLNSTVHPVPVPAFAAANVCFGNTTPFTNQSAIPSGVFVSAWSFGDGDSSSALNPVHMYQNAGTYNSQLTLTSNYGCTANITIPVSVYNLPVAQFSVSDVCHGQPAVFNDLSTSSSGTISARNWDFGDSNTDTLVNPQHMYSAFGSYPVTLVVTSSYGCADLIIDTVIIHRLPEPVIAVQNGCVSSPFTFTDVSDTAVTGASLWWWDFGDGHLLNQFNPSHNYLAHGSFTVTVLSSTAFGCTATATATVEAYPLPVASFSPGNECAGTSVSFLNSSSIPTGTISSYQWFFGDSSAISTVIQPSHVYNIPGTYGVTLVAVSNFGCTDTSWSPVTIYPNPVTNFVFDEPAGCGPLIVRFTDSSFVGGSSISSWQWDFGDGGSDASQNPVHTYLHAGNYPVTLNTITAEGCAGTFTVSNAIEVYPDPVAAFTPDPYETTVLQPVYFQNQSIDAVSWLWNFGDGGMSDLENPLHLYNDSGTYVIGLSVLNQYGCIDTTVREIKLNPVFIVYVPNAFSPNNDGKNEVFTISGIGIKSYDMLIWNRWGNLVFKGTNHAWNGRDRKGTEAQQDVYVYRIFIRDIFSETHERTGRVSLVR